MVPNETNAIYPLQMLISNFCERGMLSKVTAKKVVDILANPSVDTKSAKIEVFAGPDDIMALQLDILNSDATETHEIVNLDEARLWIPPVYDGDIRQKLVLKCKTSSIYSSSLGKSPLTELPPGHRQESRYLSPASYDLHGSIIIYADRVALTSFTPQRLTIVIHDPSLKKDFLELYRHLWNLGS